MRTFVAILCTALLAGCGESGHTLSRDYRNLNNEAIDALMIVTNESRARVANEKVITPYGERITAIDKRLDQWELNTEKVDVAKSVLTAESVVTYYAENKVNLQRLALEQARLKDLVKQLTDQNPGVNPRDAFPNLDDLAAGGKLGPLRQNLQTGGKLTDLIKKFPEWKLPQPVLELNAQFKDRLQRMDQPINLK